MIPDGNFPDGNYNHTLKVARSLVRGSIAKTVLVHVGVGGDIPASLRLSRHVAAIHRLPDAFSDETAYVRAVAELASDVRADVVLPVSEEGHRLLSRYRSAFAEGIALAPLSDERTLRIARDKGRLAAFMEARDLPHPRSLPMRPYATLRDRLADVPFPVLVKGTQSKGGFDIIRCDDLESVLAFAREQQGGEKEYIVESFVEGTDVCFCVLAVDGQVVAHTIQRALQPPSTPFSPLEFIQFVRDSQVESVGRNLVRALGFSGMACIDMRYNADQTSVYVLEINPRVWGSMLGSLRAGVNFPDLACRVALGLPVEDMGYTPTSYSVGELGVKHIWRTIQAGIPLRHSCMAYGFDDPLPDLTEFARMKLHQFAR